MDSTKRRRNRKVIAFPEQSSVGAVAVSNREQFGLVWESARVAVEAMFEAERTASVPAYRAAADAFNKAMKIVCRLVPTPEQLFPRSPEPPKPGKRRAA